MTSPEEQADLDKLKLEQDKLVQQNFRWMQELLRMDEAQLKQCGHKSLGAALEHTMRDTIKKIGKETQKFLAAWPDE
jgi:hypothetical protein